MNTGSMLRTAALALIAASLAAAPAEAQFGRLKDRVKDAAAGKLVDRAVGGGSGAAGEAGAVASGPRFSENVLEITPERLDRLRLIAAAEAQEQAHQRESGARAEAARRHRDAFEACSKPEERRAQQALEAFVERYRARAMAGDQKAVQILTDSMQILQQQLVSGVQQKCGSPSGPGESGGGADTPSVSSNDLLRQANLNHRQYSVIKERVIAFCRSGAAESLQGASRIPGDGRNIFYLYAAGEVEAIKPRCSELNPLLGEG